MVTQQEFFNDKELMRKATGIVLRRGWCITREDAEDIIEEAKLSILSRWDKIDKDLYMRKGYFLTVVLNSAKDHLRTLTRRRGLFDFSSNRHKESLIGSCMSSDTSKLYRNEIEINLMLEKMYPTLDRNEKVFVDSFLKQEIPAFSPLKNQYFRGRNSLRQRLAFLLK